MRGLREVAAEPTPHNRLAWRPLARPLAAGCLEGMRRWRADWFRDAGPDDIEFVFPEFIRRLATSGCHLTFPEVEREVVIPGADRTVNVEVRLLHDAPSGSAT